MNFRLTAILFGVVLVGGVVLLVLTMTEDKAVPTDLLAEELAALKPDQIDAVEMEREGGSHLKLVRVSKDRWDEEWDVTGYVGRSWAEGKKIGVKDGLWALWCILRY